MLSEALREYRAVSPDSPSAASTADAAADATHRTPTPIDVRQIGSIRRLAGDYAFDFEKISELYAGNPASPDAWRDAIARAIAHPRRNQEMAALLAAQQDRRGAPPEARAAAARLNVPGTVAVVTGQQATAFGGPLYTLLKALTAIQLARRVSREHGAECIAIFWVHSEDHDWAEVAGCTVLDGNFQPVTVTLPAPPGAGELPVGELALDNEIEHIINSLAAALPPTDFTETTIAALRAAYRPGARMATAFAEWLEALLGPYGLVVFEACDRVAKPLVADLFVRELREAGKTAALAAAAGQDLAARGHAPQVEPHADSVALFHINGARTAIKKHGDDAFTIGDRTVSSADLIAEAERHPEHFSPNVLLRPVVQDRMFPTICYVPGPSELAYLGQLGGVYRHFGVPMPLLFPRATATLIDSNAARFLHRYGLPLEALQPQDEATLNRLLESQLPASIEHALREAEETIHTSMQKLVDAMPALDPTLAGAARTTLGKMEHDLKGLHAKVIHSAKKRDETLRRQFTRAQGQIFPLGHPQERTLGIPYFLNRYGPALVDRLLDGLPLQLGYHYVLTV
jgi:bacillithiol biosynthesis cysteine-adding enzyme BshC